uniref:Uncharacterized protein n=1 Tax=Arundo donax TaxID=35708 RepID=A0A0A8Y918_ARUDO
MSYWNMGVSFRGFLKEGGDMGMEYYEDGSLYGDMG